jgi:hypothetical protein
MSLIDSLAGEDILKMEEVVKIPALQALTYIQYKLEMNNMEKNKI